MSTKSDLTRGVRLPAFSIAILMAAGAVAMPVFGDWSAPANLETLAGSSTTINTVAQDGCASVSPDGLTIAYGSNVGGNHDIYLATRSSTTEGFGDPVRLDPPINTSFIESCPTIARGNRLYFTSLRDDPNGDLYVSRQRSDGTWGSPTRLGSNVNTANMLEESAAFYEDDGGSEVMIFSRRQLSGAGGKIYQSIDGAPATLVAGGPHSSANDNRPSVTHDGRTIFWDSSRFGTLGGPDLWYATRSSTAEPFGSAVHLSELSSSAFDGRPFVTWNGEMLTFSSARAGSESALPDIWFATRAR